MHARYPHFNNDQNNLFLTATSNVHSTPPKLLPAHKSMQKSLESHQTIKCHILALIQEFKAAQQSPQISHLFNEILCGLEGAHGQKKSIDKIAELLQNQTNLIKLNRVWNRLKTLKKDFDRLGLHKYNKTQTKFQYLQRGSHQRMQVSQPQTASNTFHRTMPSQVNQLKSNILSQISYRQRVTKFQSQRQKHEQNRQKFIEKKLVKVKQMNKKVREIFQRNKVMQREHIQKHKYEQLYDPEEMLKRRGKTSDFKTRYEKHSSAIEDELNLVHKRANDRSVTVNLEGQGNPMSRLDKRGKNTKFAQKQQQKFTKKDLMTFKSMKQVLKQKSKWSKSFNALTNIKEIQKKQKISCASKPKQLYPQLPDSTVNRSHSQSKKVRKEKKLIKEDRLNLVMSKRLEMEEERLTKIITEAVQKQEKIIQICQRKTIQKKPSNEDSLQDLTQAKSVNSSPAKCLFKRVYTRKELLDKQRKLLADIENKLENKENFLQERVDKIRQRLKREQQTKQKHQHAWQQYIEQSENVTVLNSRQGSPQKGGKQNINKCQESVVRSSHLTKLKSMESNTQKQRLAGLTMQELKRKLACMEKEDDKKQQRVVF